MANYIISDINEMKQFLSEQLPEWEKTTAETLLTTLSHIRNYEDSVTLTELKRRGIVRDWQSLFSYASVPHLFTIKPCVVH